MNYHEQMDQWHEDDKEIQKLLVEYVEAYNSRLSPMGNMFKISSVLGKCQRARRLLIEEMLK